MKLLGLEGRRRTPDGAPCFQRQLRRCAGACVGAESAAEHAARLRELLAPWLIPAWPHAGAVALVERRADGLREDIHVYDRWCWLGTVRTLDAAQALADSAPRVFEADAARLALQAFGGRLVVECVSLAAAGGADAANAAAAAAAADATAAIDAAGPAQAAVNPVSASVS
jgi:DNA polymerase-3 subunit epsilon